MYFIPSRYFKTSQQPYDGNFPHYFYSNNTFIQYARVLTRLSLIYVNVLLCKKVTIIPS